MHRLWLIALVLAVVFARFARFWMASPRVVPIRRIAEVVPPPPRARPRYSSRSAFDRPIALAMVYLVALVVAEVATVVNHTLGLPAHAVILFALLLHGSNTQGVRRRALLWALALAPLIRLLSLSLPLATIPVIYWYALISVPIIAASIAAARALGYSRRDLGLGLRWRFVPLLVLMIPLGIGAGVMQYLLLEPRPLVRSLDLQELWLPAAILVVSTGLAEELVFRGLMQRAAIRLLGAWGGILYTTAVFTALHASYLLLGSIGLVFAMGLLFAALSWWTRSIVLPIVAHATINVTVFLIAPLALQRLSVDALSTTAIQQQVSEWYGTATVPFFTGGPIADEHALVTPTPLVSQGGVGPAPSTHAEVPSAAASTPAVATMAPTTGAIAAVREESPPTVGAALATPGAPAPMPAPVVATPSAHVSAAEAIAADTAPDAGVAVGPAPVPIPPGPTELATIFDAQFADPGHKWPNDVGSTAWFADGGYVLFAREPSRFVAVGAPIDRSLGDVVITGVFRKVGGPPGGGYGLILRDQRPELRDGINQRGRYYVFEVGDRGEFGIWRRDEDRWEDLVPWSPSDAVRPGAAPNELTVRAIGPRLTFEVNGMQVASLEDSALPAGGVGVFVGGDFNEARLERLVVRAAPLPPAPPDARASSTGRVIDGLLPAGISDESTRAMIARIAREVGEIVVDGVRGQNEGWKTLARYAAHAWSDQYRAAPRTLDQDERRVYEANRDALLDTIAVSDSPFRNYRESYIGAFRQGVDVPRARELDAVLQGHDGYTSPFSRQPR